MSSNVRRISLHTTAYGYEARFGVEGGVQLYATGGTKTKAVERLLLELPPEQHIPMYNAVWVIQTLKVEGAISCNGITALDLVNMIRRSKRWNELESLTEKHVSSHLSKDSLPSLYRNFLEQILATLEAKNHDYTGSDDPFANFRASETYGVDARKGILLRAQDKFMRINTHIDKGRLMVEGESVEDAIADVIGYMLLLYGMEVERSGDGS